jgi:predicted RNA-binding Zn ribbon-like protein
VDFDAYASQGVDLVSSQPCPRHPDDPLTSLDGLRVFLATRAWMAQRARHEDLAPLVTLRAALREVFDATGEDRSRRMVTQLNALLARHPLALSVSGHDDADWHLHVASTVSPVAVEYAAGAVTGLTMAFLDLGADRFGTCTAAGCTDVFLDTTRNRSRRFCSERCATRSHVAALRSRRRASG